MIGALIALLQFMKYGWAVHKGHIIYCIQLDRQISYPSVDVLNDRICQRVLIEMC